MDSGRRAPCPQCDFHGRHAGRPRRRRIAPGPDPPTNPLGGGRSWRGGPRVHLGRSMGIVMMLSSSVILFTPFVDDIWLLLALFTISLTGMATAISLNFSLVNDLLRNPEDSGKAMSILIVGGNAFGVAAPIVTGYAIQATGSYNWAFGIAGLLLVAGATILFTMTRPPIEIQTHPA